MSATLTIKDSITRTGITKIEGRPVVGHNCSIDSDDPSKMTITNTKLDYDLYSKNRDICRADTAEFEDLCFELQSKYLDQKESEVTE